MLMMMTMIPKNCKPLCCKEARSLITPTHCDTTTEGKQFLSTVVLVRAVGTGQANQAMA